MIIIFINLITTWAMYVQRNIQARSRKKLLPWKSNQYYILLCVFVCVCVCVCVCVGGCLGAWGCACACTLVASVIQHSTRMCHIVICGLWLHHIF
jgi:hypothetical protein